jgi:ArsR family transcriptional regulator
MSAPHPMPDQLVELVAQRFRAMGEPMRVRILDALRDGPATAQDLTARLGTSPQNISKHLGVLRAAGLVRRERDGAAVRHEIADPTVLSICEEVCGSLTREVRELGRMLEPRDAA